MKAAKKAVETAAKPYNKRAVIGLLLSGLILGVIMGLFTIFSPG
jgi:predicted lipid-binding transport protein (Tim44 family)